MERSHSAHGALRLVFAASCVLAVAGCTPAVQQRDPKPVVAAAPRGEAPEAEAAVKVEEAVAVKDGHRTAADAPASQPMPLTTTEIPARSAAEAQPASAAGGPVADTKKGKGKASLDMLMDGEGAGYGQAAGAPRQMRRRVATSSAIQTSPPPLALPQSAEFNTEAYAHSPDNPFVKVADSPLSTFSVDVDTASYSNVRRFLQGGARPPKDAVRIEELVNYFRYDYPTGGSADPFSVYTEVASAPWKPNHRLVHIGLRAREIAQAAVPARNLVFLVDVSGSMQSYDKLPLLKRGLALLARDLRPEDRIALVVYAGSSGLALPSTSGRDKARILAALENLEAGGSTNGAEGIELAYRVAQDNFVRGGINRVLLATDGDFNVGVTSEGDLTRLIEKKRESGVFLTVLGFGTGNLKDSTMERLADKGNGNYAYIDSMAEAHKVLVREAGSTLVTVAKDVKLQVEWNPTLVASYRLIGYENRVLADRDFNDDKKDAGEVGAGHTVTALYEVELAGRAQETPAVDPLKYQSGRVPTAAANSDELMTLKIRYKQPDSAQSQLRSHVVVDRGTRIEQSSNDFRWAAAVAGFGMLLRASDKGGDLTYPMVGQLARSAVGPDTHGDRRELLLLIDRAKAMAGGG